MMVPKDASSPFSMPYKYPLLAAGIRHSRGSSRASPVAGSMSRPRYSESLEMTSMNLSLPVPSGPGDTPYMRLAPPNGCSNSRLPSSIENPVSLSSAMTSSLRSMIHCQSGREAKVFSNTAASGSQKAEKPITSRHFSCS